MKILRRASLRERTTLRVGGAASFFVSVTDVAELSRAILWAQSEKMSYMILGGGSNVLFPDTGFDGLIIHMNILGVRYEAGREDVVAIVGAGEEWDAFVRDTVKRNFWGLENLSGIPGSVGATPVQNVGAYGVEVSDTISWVEVYNTNTRRVERVTSLECDFSYRSSLFKEAKHLIIVAVCFRLHTKSNPILTYKDIRERFISRSRIPSILEVRNTILEIRATKFPSTHHLGTAGSFFKNPIVNREKALELERRFPGIPLFKVGNETMKVSLAWILDHVLNVKGIRVGSVGTFEHQPLVFINYGSASSEELISFARMIRSRVKEETGVEIFPEVTLVHTTL